MEIKNLEKLTLDVYLKYKDRKKVGRISFLIDLDEDKIYPVPLEIEHKDYAPKIIGCSINEIEMFKRLIPIHIDTEYDKKPIINKIIVGVSGVEAGYGVRHYIKDLVEANIKIKMFISDGDIEIKQPLDEDKIVTRYCLGR